MADYINDNEIPVFLINGFLEAGKTAFIKYTMSEEYFQIDGRTLLIVCEEGEVEYKTEELKEYNTVMVVAEEESQLTLQYLEGLSERYRPERVIIEFNGMWNMDSLKLPKDSEVIEVKPEDYGIWFFDMKDNPERYRGKIVDFTACIMKSSRFEKDCFVPGRMAMTCCEADMTFIGFIAHAKELSAFENHAWVRLKAKVDIRLRQEYQGEGPFLEVISMARTGEIPEPVGF